MKDLLKMKDKVKLYLRHRKRLGYNPRVGITLLKFADYVDHTGYRGPLTISIAFEWASASKKGRAACARRLSTVHSFAKYYKAIDPKTEIPPLNLFGYINRRPIPYIYSNKEIRDLLNITKILVPTDGLKPVTFKYLLGLLASTGLRVSEAINLNRKDVDLDKGIITVHEGKYHKSRYVPLHNTTKEALKNYASKRDKKISFPTCNNFFITDKGRALLLIKTEQEFRELRNKLGLEDGARLYDLRHTFACHRLLKWYKEGKNINEMMIYLSVYLGHTWVTDTYWYLTAIPELMSVASKRFEQISKHHWGELQ